MNVDLIKALEAAPAEGSRNEQAGKQSEFPGVFESALGKSAGKSGARQNPALDSRAAKSADREAALKKKSDVEATADESAAAVAESGVGGAAAAAIAERARQNANAEAAAEASGRLTDLASETGADGAGAQSGEIEEGEVLEGELADEVIAHLQTERGEGDAVLESAASSPGPSATSGVVSGASELANQGRVGLDGEVTAGGATDGESDEERAAGDGDRSPREDAERGQGEAAYQRATEGSTSASVDPNLRQAIANREEALRAPEVVSVDGAASVASPVAGAMTETTTTAAPGTPMPAAASDAIAVQTEWLATRGGGTARLVLHPPELGEIAIRVTLRGGVVDVVMVAQEAVAMGVAEEQSERLAQAFANRDLRLDHFDIRRAGAEDLADGDAERFAESGSEGDQRASDDSRDLDGPANPGELGGAGEGVTPMPQILTAAPETGVDLRI